METLITVGIIALLLLLYALTWRRPRDAVSNLDIAGTPVANVGGFDSGSGSCSSGGDGSGGGCGGSSC